MSTQFNKRVPQNINSSFTLLIKLTQLLFIAGSILIFSSLNAYSSANEKNLEYKVKAAYLYNFTKFVKWPDDVLSNTQKKTLNICILGKDPFGHAIDLLLNKTAQGHSVAIEYIKEVNPTTQCHVVFITRSKSNKIEQILSQLSEKNVLTVSDIDQFAIKGGCISLQVFKGKVRFNVNKKAADNADLKISAKLLELAKAVFE